MTLQGRNVFRFARTAMLVGFALTASCSGDSPSAPAVYTTQFTATNELIAPITILVDGLPNVILANGMSAPVTVSTRSHVTWTSAKPADATGHAIPDEIGINEISVHGTNAVLEITNVINDQPYFTASVHNYTNITVSIGVFDGSTVACAAVLPAAQSSPGFVQTGYYRLTASTELRAYLNANGCTGSFVTWPSSQLSGYAPKSGWLQVALTSGQ